jgi:chromosome segregation ATPase
MAKDNKKGKKGKNAVPDPSELADQLTAVDRQFYELTIADLNGKLARLRTNNAKLEETNEELEGKMKIMDEDRLDVTAYLNRTLREKLHLITELEDKLAELSKVRSEENIDCKKKMTEWDIKYKSMFDELTSEIKLLNGKLSSMEEFRIQRIKLYCTIWNERLLWTKIVCERLWKAVC